MYKKIGSWTLACALLAGFTLPATEAQAYYSWNPYWGYPIQQQSNYDSIPTYRAYPGYDRYRYTPATPTTTESPVTPAQTHMENTPASSDIEKVIAMGRTYMGTPYEFGSDRQDPSTFDCSDFMKHIFKQALDIDLPSDSRKQGDYVRDKSSVTTDWSQLKRGDLMFFMTYQGSDATDYRSKEAFGERITHVGIYLGHGQILHTYSQDSGGVRIDELAGSAWEHRFLFGGSAITSP